MPFMIKGYDDWKTAIPEEVDYVEKRLSGSGYVEIGTLNFVPEEDAFGYALEQCVKVVPNGIHGIPWTQEFREMLVEWFFSGSWVKEEK